MSVICGIFFGAFPDHPRGEDPGPPPSTETASPPTMTPCELQPSSVERRTSLTAPLRTATDTPISSGSPRPPTGRGWFEAGRSRISCSPRPGVVPRRVRRRRRHRAAPRPLRAVRTVRTRPPAGPPAVATDPGTGRHHRRARPGRPVRCRRGDRSHRPGPRLRRDAGRRDPRFPIPRPQPGRPVRSGSVGTPARAGATTRVSDDLGARNPDGSDGASALRGDHPGIEAGQV